MAELTRQQAVLEERMNTTQAKLDATLERLRTDQEKMKSSIMIWIAVIGGLIIATAGLIIAVVTSFLGGGGSVGP